MGDNKYKEKNSEDKNYREKEDKKSLKQIKLTFDRKSNNFFIKRNKLFENRTKVKSCKLDLKKMERNNIDLKKKLKIIESNYEYELGKKRKYNLVNKNFFKKRNDEFKNAFDKKKIYYEKKNRIFELEKEIYNLEVKCNNKIREKKNKLSQYDRAVEKIKQAKIDLEELDKEIEEKNKQFDLKKDEYREITKNLDELMVV